MSEVFAGPAIFLSLDNYHNPIGARKKGWGDWGRKAVAEVTENEEGEECAKCGNVGDSLLVGSVS